MKLERPTGMPCPNCSTFIMMSIEGLLTSAGFQCPNPECRTVLQLNRDVSRKSLEVLEKFQRETAGIRKLQQDSRGARR